MKKERDRHGQLLQRCFSDAIFRIDAKGNKARRVLFCSEYTIYIFDGEKHLKLTRQFPIEKINTIIFSETSPILCCFKIDQSEDCLFETFKRSELNSYLTEIVGSR